MAALDNAKPQIGWRVRTVYVGLDRSPFQTIEIAAATAFILPAQTQRHLAIRQCGGGSAEQRQARFGDAIDVEGGGEAKIATSSSTQTIGVASVFSAVSSAVSVARRVALSSVVARCGRGDRAMVGQASRRTDREADIASE